MKISNLQTDFRCLIKKGRNHKLPHGNYAFYAGSAKRSTPQNKVLDVKTIISLIRKFSGSGGKNEFQAISWYLLNNYNSINVKNKKNESFELYLEC